MKIAINYSVEVGDADRRAIAAYYDDKDIPGYTQDGELDLAEHYRLATRNEVKEWFETYGQAGEGNLNDIKSTLELE